MIHGYISKDVVFPRVCEMGKLTTTFALFDRSRPS